MHGLIVKISSLGDIVCALPAVTDAQRVYPEITFDWVAEEGFCEIPKFHSAVSRVIPFALRRWRHQLGKRNTYREMWCFYQQLRMVSYDFIIDPQGLLKSALVGYLSRGTTHGFDFASIREKFAAIFYRRRYPVAKCLHTVRRMRELFAQVLSYAVPTIFGDYGFKVERDAAEPRYLMLLHGTSRSSKCWDEEHWIELAQLAVSEGFRIKIPWGNAEEYARSLRIAEFVPQATVLPRLNLTELAKLLADAAGVVTVDTGLGHLAAALAVPSVALYGVTDPFLAGTWGENQKHLSAMDQISALEVWKTLQTALNQAASNKFIENSVAPCEIAGIHR